MSTSWKLLWQIKSKAIFTCCFENCTKKDQCSTCGVVTKTNFFMLKFLFSWVALNTFTVWSVFRIIVSTVYFLNSRLWIAAEFFTHFFSIPTWGSFRQGSLSTYQPLELFRIILLKIWNFKFCFFKICIFFGNFFSRLAWGSNQSEWFPFSPLTAWIAFRIIVSTMWNCKFLSL